MMFTTLLPSLHKRNFRKVNLDDLFADNPVRTPQEVDDALRALHSELQATTYGGWMEDRGRALADTYLKHDERYIHLGVDINAPFKTLVHSPLEGTIKEIWNDPDIDGGWGTRIIIAPDLQRYPYIILGHLDKQLAKRTGDHVARGELLGVIGTWPQNGSWYDHLHVQCARRDVLDTLADWHELDGYGTRDDTELRSKYPDPMPLIG